MTTTAAQVTRERLHEMMQAYKLTSLLRTGVDLGIFDSLGDGPGAGETLAGRLGADPRGMRIMLNALCAVGLLATDGNQYRLAPGGERLLVSKSPEYLGDMVRVMASDWEWDALKQLTDAVRHGGAVVVVHAETPGYQYWEDFAAYATAIAVPTANRMVEALAPWAAERESLDVLDVACGHGLYGFTFARRYPQAQVWALDWANVLAVAEQHAARLGVRDQTHLIAGDMFDVPLGGPYDVVMVTNVLHHFSEQRATELLGRMAPALKPGGRLALVGFTLGDEPPADDPLPHLFSILMLVWTNHGEVHSGQTYDRMLAASGFTNSQVYTVPTLPLRVLIAERRS